MKMMTITLPPDIPPVVRRVLEAIPNVLVQGGVELTIDPPGGTPIGLALIQRDEIVEHADHVRLAAKTKKRLSLRQQAPLLHASRLATSLRTQLREAGINYVDGSGHVAIVGDGIYLVLDKPERVLRVPTSETLGHVGIRAAQVLVDHRADHWSTTELAERASISVGQAHKVLHVLEREGLVHSGGTRNRREREVADRGKLLDWIAAHRLVREPTEPTVLGYIPARNLAGIVKALHRPPVGNVFSVTGLAAAALYGHPVATNVPVTSIRVAGQPGADVASIAQQLGVEVVERGANVRIIRDTGGVGTYDVRQLAGQTPVAPPSRVYLDMLTEGRGEDAAELFRATALELAT